MWQDSSRARRSGFTLLEVMVALLLLAGAFLAVAGLLTAAGRTADRSRVVSIAAALAAQKIEQLRSLSFGYDIDGSPLDEMALSPPGSLGADMPGFVDYLSDSGTPVGAGPPAPAAAVFTRRWSVESDAAVAPPEVLLLRVAVFRRQLSSAVPGGGFVWVEVARVVTARARRAS